ncbi:MAG: hypothetical protein FWG11_06115 [Promicromonosporaceae bacterium]|nr:hypothetical protein [Promicromonosporaceae bacterium]
MSGRRPPGAGSVYQRAGDGKWIAAIEAGTTAKGTRRRIVVTGHTRAEAARKLRAKQRQIARDGIGPAELSDRATVKTWARC